MARVIVANTPQDGVGDWLGVKEYTYSVNETTKAVNISFKRENTSSDDIVPGERYNVFNYDVYVKSVQRNWTENKVSSSIDFSENFWGIFTYSYYKNLIFATLNTEELLEFSFSDVVYSDTKIKHGDDYNGDGFLVGDELGWRLGDILEEIGTYLGIRVIYGFGDSFNPCVKNVSIPAGTPLLSSMLQLLAQYKPIWNLYQFDEPTLVIAPRTSVIDSRALDIAPIIDRVTDITQHESSNLPPKYLRIFGGVGFYDPEYYNGEETVRENVLGYAGPWFDTHFYASTSDTIGTVGGITIPNIPIGYGNTSFIVSNTGGDYYGSRGIHNEGIRFRIAENAQTRTLFTERLGLDIFGKESFTWMTIEETYRKKRVSLVSDSQDPFLFVGSSDVLGGLYNTAIYNNAFFNTLQKDTMNLVEDTNNTNYMFPEFDTSDYPSISLRPPTSEYDLESVKVTFNYYAYTQWWWEKPVLRWSLTLHGQHLWQQQDWPSLADSTSEEILDYFGPIPRDDSKIAYPRDIVGNRGNTKGRWVFPCKIDYEFHFFRGEMENPANEINASSYAAPVGGEPEDNPVYKLAEYINSSAFMRPHGHFGGKCSISYARLATRDVIPVPTQASAELESRVNSNIPGFAIVIHPNPTWIPWYKIERNEGTVFPFASYMGLWGIENITTELFSQSSKEEVTRVLYSSTLNPHQLDAENFHNELTLKYGGEYWTELAYTEAMLSGNLTSSRNYQVKREISSLPISQAPQTWPRLKRGVLEFPLLEFYWNDSDNLMLEPTGTESVTLSDIIFTEDLEQAASIIFSNMLLDWGTLETTIKIVGDYKDFQPDMAFPSYIEWGDENIFLGLYASISDVQVTGYKDAPLTTLTIRGFRTEISEEEYS